MPRIIFPAPSLEQFGPELQGFDDAQARLRARFGVDAVFLIPGLQTWPAGTPLDPETGRPYDPFTEPETAATPLEITLRCSFVHRPLENDDPAATPIGAGDRGSAALIVQPEDFPNVRAATRVRLREETWEIQLWRYDIALTFARWIVYLEHA